MKTVFYGFVIILILSNHTDSIAQKCLSENEKLHGHVTTYSEEVYRLDDILFDQDSGYIIDVALKTLLDSFVKGEYESTSMLSDLEDYKLFYVLEDSFRVILHENGAQKHSYNYCKGLETESLSLCSEFEMTYENNRLIKYVFKNYLYIPSLLDLRDTTTTIVTAWDSSGNVLLEEVYNDSLLVGKIEYAYADDCSVEYFKEYAVNDTTGQLELAFEYSISYQFDDKRNITTYDTGDDFDYIYRYLEFDEYGNWTKRVLLTSSVFGGYYPLIIYRSYDYD